MVILDANILIFSFNHEAIEHKPCASWLKGTTKAGTSMGLPWVSILAFLRVTTNPKLSPKPTSMDRAVEFIDSLLDNENYRIIEASQESFSVFAKLCAQVSVTPKLFTDVYLASLALENQATLVSTDFDFAKFVPAGLNWFNPLAKVSNKRT